MTAEHAAISLLIAATVTAFCFGVLFLTSHSPGHKGAAVLFFLIAAYGVGMFILIQGLT